MIDAFLNRRRLFFLISRQLDITDERRLSGEKEIEFDSRLLDITDARRFSGEFGYIKFDYAASLNLCNFFSYSFSAYAMIALSCLNSSSSYSHLRACSYWAIMLAFSYLRSSSFSSHLRAWSYWANVLLLSGNPINLSSNSVI